MQKNTRVVRSATFAAIVGLTMTMGATGAVAQDAPPQPAPTVSNIDQSATGSITVHKRSSATNLDTNDTGNEIINPPGDPLEGATFTVQRVNADLSTNDGFAAARDLTPATATTTGDGTAITTGADGIATFGNLPVGVYLVTETVTPAGHLGSAPFLVFVPMTNPEDLTEWNYDPHVYPKNTPVDAPIKEVDDADMNVGDEITFTIRSQVPAPAEGGTISKYIVNDDLQEEHVATAADRVTVAVGGVEYVRGTDYTVNVNEATQEVSVVFTPEGLAKLTAAKRANANVEVVTTIEVTVQELDTDPDGKLTNTSTVIYNNGSGSGDTTVDSNEVETYWGKLQVVKSGDRTDDEIDQSVPLAGAKFELYRCTDQNTLDGTKLTVNGASEWITDAEGKILIDALHVTDFEDGAEVAETYKYCLVETEAPAGFELLADPVAVDFKRADVAAVNPENPDDNAVTLVANIENVPSTTPNLPLTGGAGIGLIAALGALLVGAGAWWAKRNASKA